MKQQAPDRRPTPGNAPRNGWIRAVWFGLFAAAGFAAAASAAEPFGPELLEALDRYGEVPVMITLRVPAYEELARIDLSGGAGHGRIEAISREILATADNVVARLAGRNFSQVKRFEYFPLLAMVADDVAIHALAQDAAVEVIALDVPSPPLLHDTIPLIQANNNHFLNFTGSGYSIAILDTGVDRNHPGMFGRVISEACYSSNVPSQGASSLCPGGATSSTAFNSALPCPAGVTGCDHGTHVAHIAASVATSAWLIPIQVFSRFTDSGGNNFCQSANRTSPCTLSYTSDQVSALNRVWALHISGNNIRVAAANMSLGAGSHAGPCDHLSEYNALRLAINQLRDQQVATVISAGNSGFRSAMAAPACLTPAVSVAATDKSDQVASYSNISAFTTLLAPGSSVFAAVPQTSSPIYQQRNGTSMAAPHVAGAIATFKEGQPGATVTQIASALGGTGPLITDQRPGGSVSKRRLSAWAALCALIICDADDFRSLGASQTLNGLISPAGDVDIYYFFGSAGQRLTLRMNRSSGSMDPYLELFSPGGFRVAFNDNGGGGVNALINGYLLPQNGLYQIRARSVNNFTGNYQVISSTQAETLNPVPQISHLSPSSATGTFFGSDFWVAIYGSNFMPESIVRLNGVARAKFYSSQSLIYIRVLGGDITWPWPRNAFITVTNPTPGGGISNSRAFSILEPFLGESRLLDPDSGSGITVGEKQAFTVEWEAPADTGTWRDMQYMDMRLRNDLGETAAWIRVVEAPGTGSFYRLMNDSGEIIDEGAPGEARDLEIPDIVTLHLAESTFSGSGLVAVMSPMLTFGPDAVGTYNVEFRVDSKSGTGEESNVQDDDVLGTFAVLPAACDQPVADVAISGAAVGQTAVTYTYTASVSPADASEPLVYTWFPEPETGQGTAAAQYKWDSAGEKVAGVSVENCGSFAAAAHVQNMRTTSFPDLSIVKRAPLSAVGEQPFEYLIEVMNSGLNDAENVEIRDTLPAGASYVSSSEGGVLDGDEVVWNIGALPGYGGRAEVSFTVTALTDAVNSVYSVAADGGYAATGEHALTTRIVDARVKALSTESRSLEKSGVARVTVPGGNVFAQTVITFEQLPSTSHDPPAGAGALVSAFLLGAHDENAWIEDFQFGDSIELLLSHGTVKIMCTAILAAATEYAFYEVSGKEVPGLFAWTGAKWSGEGIDCALADALFGDRFQQLGE